MPALNNYNVAVYPARHWFRWRPARFRRHCDRTLARSAQSANAADALMLFAFAVCSVRFYDHTGLLEARLIKSLVGRPLVETRAVPEAFVLRLTGGRGCLVSQQKSYHTGSINNYPELVAFNRRCAAPAARNAPYDQPTAHMAEAADLMHRHTHRSSGRAAAPV